MDTVFLIIIINTIIIIIVVIIRGLTHKIQNVFVECELIWVIGVLRPKVTWSGHSQSLTEKENLAVFGSRRGHQQGLLNWYEPGMNRHFTNTHRICQLRVSTLPH